MEDLQSCTVYVDLAITVPIYCITSETLVPPVTLGSSTGDLQEIPSPEHLLCDLPLLLSDLFGKSLHESHTRLGIQCPLPCSNILLETPSHHPSKGQTVSSPAVLQQLQCRTLSRRNILKENL